MEVCRDCKFVGKIYYPPTREAESHKVNGCFLFVNEPDGIHNDIREVMYLNDLNGHCEEFTPKEKYGSKQQGNKRKHQGSHSIR